MRPISIERHRKVSRVLVMLEYGEGEPCNGEVFDLTALANELALKDDQHAHSRVGLTVRGGKDYSAERLPSGHYPIAVKASWDVMVRFNGSGESAYLDDAVNASMAQLDTEDAGRIMKSIRKTEKKLEELKKQLKDQRLMEAAEIRAKNPVCRITQSPLGLVGPGTANGKLGTTDEGGTEA